MTLRSREMQELENGEAWLTGFATPPPSVQAVARAKAAVRAEAAQAARRTWPFGPAAGFWAAAAMLLLSVGIVWQATVSDADRRPLPVDGPMAAVEDADEAVLTALASELADLDSSSAIVMDSSLEGLLDEIQDLEAEAARFWDS